MSIFMRFLNEGPVRSLPWDSLGGSVGTRRGRSRPVNLIGGSMKKAALLLVFVLVISHLSIDVAASGELR